eukprot:TRINITY_DN3366_c0_g1_i2.p1 TRINITY_DN3366_c0_g1~~TRINITY_DN3366_c0_g1_i2.p1  ORF type:complete len:167 (-),score=47.89 TRINITY_DN3366_c0_g1_i2:39-539(-)
MALTMTLLFFLVLATSVPLLAALPATSLLQVTVQLQRGSVGEISPSTLSNAQNDTSRKTAAPTSKEAAFVARARQETAIGKEHKPCIGCQKASEAELDLLEAAEEFAEDGGEVVALASQVSLMQTSLEHQHAPARRQALDQMHASGIDDTDEALGLLDLAGDLGLA